MICSKIIIDKANRWIIPGKNALNRCRIGVFNQKELNSGVKSSWSEPLKSISRGVLISSEGSEKFRKNNKCPPPLLLASWEYRKTELKEEYPIYPMTIFSLFIDDWNCMTQFAYLCQILNIVLLQQLHKFHSWATFTSYASF